MPAAENKPVSLLDDAGLPLADTDLFYVVQALTSSGARKLHYSDILNDSGVTAGTYGDSTHVPQLAVNAKGRVTSVSNVAISGGGGGGSVPDFTQAYITDHFLRGDATSGQVGELNWYTNGGGLTFQVSEAGYPGIALLTRTGAGVAGFFIGKGANATFGRFADSFDLYFVIRTNQTTNCTIRIGIFEISTSSIADPPASGIYFEFIAGTDTNWQGVTRSASSQTRTTTAAAVGTSFVKLRLRRIDASTIGFTVGSGTEATATMTIPTGTGYVNIQVKSASGNPTASIDRFDQKITGLNP